MRTNILSLIVWSPSPGEFLLPCSDWKTNEVNGESSFHPIRVWIRPWEEEEILGKSTWCLMWTPHVPSWAQESSRAEPCYQGTEPELTKPGKGGVNCLEFKTALLQPQGSWPAWHFNQTNITSSWWSAPTSAWKTLNKPIPVQLQSWNIP